MKYTLFWIFTGSLFLGGCFNQRGHQALTEKPSKGKVVYEKNGSMFSTEVTEEEVILPNDGMITYIQANTKNSYPVFNQSQSFREIDGIRFYRVPFQFQFPMQPENTQTSVENSIYLGTISLEDYDELKFKSHSAQLGYAELIKRQITTRYKKETGIMEQEYLDVYERLPNAVVGKVTHAGSVLELSLQTSKDDSQKFIHQFDRDPPREYAYPLCEKIWLNRNGGPALEPDAQHTECDIEQGDCNPLINPWGNPEVDRKKIKDLLKDTNNECERWASVEKPMRTETIGLRINLNGGANALQIIPAAASESANVKLLHQSFVITNPEIIFQ